MAKLCPLGDLPLAEACALTSLVKLGLKEIRPLGNHFLSLAGADVQNLLLYGASFIFLAHVTAPLHISLLYAFAAMPKSVSPIFIL